MLCKAERNTRTRGESGEKLERKIDAMPSKYRELADKEFNARRNLNVVKSVEIAVKIAVKNVRRVWKLGSKRFGASNDKRSGKITVKNILRAGQLLGEKYVSRREILLSVFLFGRGRKRITTTILRSYRIYASGRKQALPVSVFSSLPA